MAQAVALELTAAHGLVLDWQLLDWQIPAGTLFANNEPPLAVIAKIAHAAGGLLQTTPGGTLLVLPSYPISPPAWAAAPTDYVFSDEADFFSQEEQYEVRPGYNRVLVTDQLTTSDRLTLETEAVSGSQKIVRAYQTPWTGGLVLKTSGGSWVSIYNGGERVATVTETVEFVGGIGRTSKPIYFIDDLVWRQVQLGAVLHSEDGALQAEVAGQSLLLLTYRTRFHQWWVTDPNIEDVQFYAEKA